MQTGTDVDLKSLRQPIRWRDLFFTRHASPILEFARTSQRQKFAIQLASLVALLPIAWLYRLYWSQKPQHGVEDVFASCVIASWLALEGLCLLSGLRLGWMASPAVRRRRIGDMVLTELSPLEICQYVGANRIWRPCSGLLIITAGIILMHLILFPKQGYFIIGYALVSMNTIITLYMTHWMQTALFVSTNSRITAIRRQLMFAFAYALLVLWLVIIHMSISVTLIQIGIRQHDDLVFVSMAVPMMIPFWWLKYRIARAYAERIEQAIFHRIEM